MTQKAAVLLLVTGMSSAFIAAEARAATADVLARGQRYCASTHPNHGTPGGFGAAIDLNGTTDDYRWPVYAPGKGRVRIYSSGNAGFGNSIIWTSANGRERIHLAHLDSFGRTGNVRAGDEMGRVGSTGQSTGSHLHASASIGGSPARLVFHGEVIEPGRCYTSAGPTPPRCLERDATVVGTGGRDRLVGSSADDVFVARGGRDVIKSRGGADTICGGPGTDRLIGGSGGDRISGAKGSDRLTAGYGQDRLEAGAGRDRLVGQRGSDRLSGGPGADALQGGTGGDHLYGNGDADRLAGGLDNDDLVGGPGGDRLSDGAGADLVHCGGGDDSVDGGTGADALIGGLGLDLVSYRQSAYGVGASLEAKQATTPEAIDTLAGFEALRGSKLADLLTGDANDNSIHGGDGDDMLDGLGGNNTLDGEAGFDTCLNGPTIERCEAGSPRVSRRRRP